MSEDSGASSKKKFTAPPLPTFLNDATPAASESQESLITPQQSDYMELVSGLEKKSGSLGTAFRQKRESLKPKLTLALRGRFRQSASLLSLKFWKHWCRKRLRTLRKSFKKHPGPSIAVSVGMSVAVVSVFIVMRAGTGDDRTPRSGTPSAKIVAEVPSTPASDLAKTTVSPQLSVSTTSIGSGQNKIQKNVGSNSLQEVRPPAEIKGTIVAQPQELPMAQPPTDELNNLINSPVTPPASPNGVSYENPQVPEYHLDPSAVFSPDTQRSPAGEAVQPQVDPAFPPAVPN